MLAEIHCPECGVFFFPFGDEQIKACPRCGNVQAIILPEATHIIARFKSERSPYIEVDGCEVDG